jgi:hypothetical protein
MTLVDTLYVWAIGADRVATITWSTGAVCTEALARASIVELMDLSGGARLPVLADIRKWKSMTRDARTFYGNATDSFSALALLVSSPATRMTANFFIGVNRPNVPTQMFTDEAEALRWLRHSAVA